MDELGNFMPVPGNGRAKRARIDREGNFVSAKSVYAYNTLISPAVRFDLGVTSGAFLNVLSYGLLNDNSTDNAPLFNTLLADPQFQGVAWYFPRGSYRFGSPIVMPINTKLYGDHYGNSVIVVDDDTAASTFVTINNNDSAVYDLYFKYQGTATDYTLFGGNNLARCYIEKVQTDAAQFSVFAAFTGASRAWIEDCIVYADDTGISAAGTSRIFVHSCSFDVNANAASNAIVTTDTATIHTSHCYFNWASTNLFVLASGGSTAVNNVYTPTTVNIFTGAGSAGTGLTIENEKVVGQQGAAVADAAGGATVDAEARTAINTLLARLRAHGLIAT